MAEIAETFGVAKSTLYRAMGAYQDQRDCALIVYRNTRTRKIDPDTLRRCGETGAGTGARLEANRKWFHISPARRPRLKAVVYVAAPAE